MKDALLKRKSTFAFESNQEFGKELKIPEFARYPNKDFVFKISYACISTTSVAAVFCSFYLPGEYRKLKEREGNPPN